MDTITTLSKIEIWHKAYNLDKKDNLAELPSREAIFGIFGIVNEEPVNCRYISETDNLQESVRKLFEYPESEGMKKFMQGAWIQMIQYELMPGSTKAQRQDAIEQWALRYKPQIDDEGEYPGYY